MRKSNSEFKTAFISEAGAELANNDYFAYVELEEYACYVLASGITDFRHTEAAKQAVENFILSFQENPTMSKSALGRYLADTNKRLAASTDGIGRMKASVVAVVTDYEKFRYLSAGNVRLKLYRQGRLMIQSRDMSLAQDQIRRRESETVLDRHEERHNLYAYLGKPDSFNPFISGKIPLNDGDIIAFYSGGFWEHVDSLEIDEIFREAGNEPRDSIDNLEDLLLSRQPDDLKSYSFATIFVNKAFRDPEKAKRRRRYIKIAVIVLIVILIISLIGYFLYRRHMNKVEEFKQTEEDAITYISSNNYIRAKESLDSALSKAKDLGERDEENRIRKYLVVVDGIVAGDDAMKAKEYSTAYDSFMTALENSREADLIGQEYLKKRIDVAESFLFVSDFLSLGNKAESDGDLEKAEAIYYKARDKAAEIHDDEGRKSAVDALSALYDKRAKQKEEGEKKIKEAGAQAVADAMKKGDELMEKGDVEGAEKAYLEARAIANSNGDPNSRQDAMKSLEQVHQAKAEKAAEETKTVDERNRNFAIAADAASRGDSAFVKEDYVSAQVYYQSAIDKFTELGEKDMAENIKPKLAAATAKQQAGVSAITDAQAMESDARSKYASKDYPGAKQSAVKAKQLYIKLGNQAKVDEMSQLISEIEMDAVIEDNLR